ncbi:MAG TPA: hypothetical protein VIA18_07040 [Polyangia bacterium]|nr:hypothetical protein [Polyangia bacterium]
MRALQLILAAAAAVTHAGCPAAHGSYPTNACMTDRDCYQGERCQSATICVATSTTTVDMSVEDTSQDLGPTTGDDQ